MTKQAPSTISIPSSLIPQFEAWGRLTTNLFQQLNRQIEMRQHNSSDDQGWYWHSQWQKWEQEADTDILTGQVKKFDSIDALLADLDV